MTAGSAHYWLGSSNAYTPAVPADWGPIDPTTIANALDQLAATNRAGTLQNAAPVGPANPCTWISGAVTPVASGKFLVWLRAYVEASIAANVTLTVLADGVTLVGTDTVSVFDGGGVVFTPLTIFGFVSLNNAVNHTFTVDMSSMPGPTFTFAANSVHLMWLELGG